MQIKPKIPGLLEARVNALEKTRHMTEVGDPFNPFEEEADSRADCLADGGAPRREIQGDGREPAWNSPAARFDGVIGPVEAALPPALAFYARAVAPAILPASLLLIGKRSGRTER